MSQNIGKQVREIRENRGFTQGGMGAKLGITQQGYIKLEKNLTKDSEHLDKIAKLLDFKDKTQLLGLIEFIGNKNIVDVLTDCWEKQQKP